MHCANSMHSEISGQLGWLRDLMQQAPTPMRSLGDLSRAALRSGDWPSDTKMQPRSLRGAVQQARPRTRSSTGWVTDPAPRSPSPKRSRASLEDIRARLKRRQEKESGGHLAAPSSRCPRLGHFHSLEEPLFPGIPSRGAGAGELRSACTGSRQRLGPHASRALARSARVWPASFTLETWTEAWPSCPCMARCSSSSKPRTSGASA